MAAFPYIPWSFLDLPAGIVPVGEVREEDEREFEEFASKDKDMVSKVRSAQCMKNHQCRQ